MKIKLETNLFAGVLSLVFAVAVWIAIPYQIGKAGGSIAANPRLFPQIFCAIIGLLGIILIFSSIVLHQKSVKEINLPKEGKKLLYFLIVAVYVFCMGWFGFLIPSIIFVVVTLLYCKCYKPSYYIIGGCFAAALYTVFTYVLGVHFP